MMVPPVKTKLVGILNITPDSFSDGGDFLDAAKALKHGKELIEEGAAVLDIGAESTRPGAIPLTGAEEWERLDAVLPNLILMAKAAGVGVSVDTYHPETAQKAIALGVDWINDVSGFSNPLMIEAVKDAKVQLVVMHNLGVPADKNRTLPEGCNPVAEVYQWAEAKFAALQAKGISRNRLIFDPGLGFGKTAEQSLALVKGIAAFRELNVPLFVGHSRKSFLSRVGADREEATKITSSELAAKGVDYLRVHDIKGNRGAIKA
ncbi:MAG: folKP [Rickettsiales bacterium]|jgi:dihydropteroate synthase|nr:folKP [Rickettsiales bacterium]